MKRLILLIFGLFSSVLTIFLFGKRSGKRQIQSKITEANNKVLKERLNNEKEAAEKLQELSNNRNATIDFLQESDFLRED